MLKAVLRRCHIDPPHWRDVGQILVDNVDKLPPAVQADLQKIVELSARLRKERELAFYGDEDFIPSRYYTQAIARDFLDSTGWLVKLVQGALK